MAQMRPRVPGHAPEWLKYGLRFPADAVHSREKLIRLLQRRMGMAQRLIGLSQSCMELPERPAEGDRHHHQGHRDDEEAPADDAKEGDGEGAIGHRSNGSG